MKKIILGFTVALGMIFAISYSVADVISNEIVGCVKKTGELFILSEDECHEKKGTVMTWNVQGPKGEPGAAGKTLKLFDGAGEDLGLLFNISDDSSPTKDDPNDEVEFTLEVRRDGTNITFLNKQTGIGESFTDESSIEYFIFNPILGDPEVTIWMRQALRNELETETLSQVIAKLSAAPKTYIFSRYPREKQLNPLTVYKTYDPVTTKIESYEEDNIHKTVTSSTNQSFAWPLEIREI